MTICGVEVWGSFTGNKTRKVADAEATKDHKKLKITKADQSGVDKRWPWEAKKVSDAEKPQPNIRDRKTHTCSHSDFIPGNWNKFDFDEAEVSKVKLMGRNDCCQARNFGNKVYVGGKLCGVWPKGQKNDWVEFSCPDGTKGTDVKIVQPRGTALTICGVEVYGKETGEKAEEDKDKKKEIMFQLESSDQSSIHSKFQWSAAKLVQYMGAPVTDVSGSWGTQTCTYSKNETGAW